VKRDYRHSVIRISEEGKAESVLNLISEEPLSIRIQGKPYTVIMRTPGDEIAHVAGFCLGEGLVDSPDDFGTLAYCEGDVNVVTATLIPERKEKIPELLLRRSYISQTSCGICGKEMLDDLRQQIPKIGQGSPMDTSLIIASLKVLPAHQPLRDRTRASHGAALFSADGEFLASAEDVGRHNALDKVVGKLFLEKKLHTASLLVLSSRISYELVQKAARAGVPVVAGVSMPTALALDLALGLDMALVCQDGANGVFVFCGHHRLNII